MGQDDEANQTEEEAKAETDNKPEEKSTEAQPKQFDDAPPEEAAADPTEGAPTEQAPPEDGTAQPENVIVVIEADQTAETPAPQEEAEEEAPTVEEEAKAVSLAEYFKPKKKKSDGTFGEGIEQPEEMDVLNGRGANVNSHKGNQKFRGLCFQRKPEFEAGNHAAKRRIATEIVEIMLELPARFLKKREKTGPWFQLSKEKAILKACQVMRDFERPDRVQLREMAKMNARKRQRAKPPSTPMPETPAPPVPEEGVEENPYGVHNHDVLSGRGAFVNGHVGNQRFRKLAQERKDQFESGNYSEKRSLATDIVGIIRSLDPPGRFLKRVYSKKDENNLEAVETAATTPSPPVCEWEELSDDRAIHKACQVMRDIDRPDREHRKNNPKKARTASASADKESIVATADATAMEEVVRAAEAALETVMEGVTTDTAVVVSATTADAEKPTEEEEEEETKKSDSIPI